VRGQPPVTAFGEATSLSEWKRHAGQRLVIGIAGTSISQEERALIREIQPAGFVLFKRNVEEPAQVRELNRELTSLVDPSRPPILSADQEGGRVQRVRDPATVWPPMRHVGRAGGLTAQISEAMAKELRAMGFNLNFAPVADVDSNPKNPVIGDRSFSASPREVAEHVTAFIKAHQKQGVVACAKHFPGHGDTSVDSHLDLPKVEREEPDLREVELAPFRAAVEAKVGSVMTAHVIFCAFDEELPATLSPRVLKRLLRDEMGYDGVVFSDDLEMKAVHGRWPIEDIVRKGSEAGVDVFLACKEPELQLAAFEALVRDQQERPAYAKRARTAAKRVMAMRERFWKKVRAPIGLDVIGCAEHKILATLAAERGKP
jgi:beta-N-acetylhexosaminidase